MTTSADTASTQRMPGFPEFIALTALMMGLTALSIDIMLPALGAIDAHFAISNANDRQLVVSAYFVGFAAGQVVYGPLSDRFGRKPILMAGLSIFALASLATVLAGDFAALLAARAVQGIGCAAPRVIAIAVVRDLFGGRRMARVMSFVMMVFITVPILAPAVGEAIMLVAEWRAIFVFLLVMGIVTMAWSALRLPETRSAGDREPLSARWLARAVWTAASTRVTLGYTIAAGLVFGALLGYINSAQQIFDEVYDAGRWFALLFAVIAVALALASFVNGRLVERQGMRRLTHGAVILFTLVALVHTAIVLAIGTPPLWLFCALLALDLFFFGVMMPNFNALAMEPLGRIAGTASSFVGAFTTATAALAGWYVGSLFDGTVMPLVASYLVLGALSLAAILLTERGRLFEPAQGR